MKKWWDLPCEGGKRRQEREKRILNIEWGKGNLE